MPPIRRFTALAIIGIVLLLVAACGAGDDEDATPTPGSGGSEPTATESAEPTPTAGQEQPALDGTAWLLAGINGVDLDLQEPITLHFEDGQASGYSGCNEYGGAFTSGEDGSFAIPEIEQTDMACESGMDLEVEYLSTLAEASNYEVIEDARLELSDGNGNTLLVFTSDTREALDGTSWTLIELDGENTLPETEPTLELRAGEASGSTGCNDFGAMYEATDTGEISLSDLFWTEVLCTEPEGVMEQEQAYLDALRLAASWERDIPNDRLLMMDGDGQTRLIFANAEQEMETRLLDGTTWVLDEISGEPVDLSQPVTIRFDASQLVGQIGCTSYYSPISTEPDSAISFLSVITYDKTCELPDALEYPTDDYVTALENSRRYRLSTDRLELLDDAGEPLLTFHAALADGGELGGTSWQLASLDGAEPISGTTITLEFDSEGLGGNSGCNGYGARYIMPEAGLLSIPEVESDAQGCNDPAGVMEQEIAYQTALSLTASYELANDRLTLFDASDNALLVFKRASG